MKTIEEFKTEIPLIEGDIEKLETSLSAKRTKLRLYKIMVYQLENDLALNDVLEFKYGKEIKRGSICEFRINWNGVVPVVTLYKKDGSLGTCTKEFWRRETFTKII